MKDENYCTIGGRVTHPPGIYSATNQGFLEVKVAAATDKAKLEAFAQRLPVGRKVCIHNAELQMKEWEHGESGERKRSFHLFCRLDQIYLHALPTKHDKAEQES